MPVEEIVKILKNNGISINMDFIYGLPGQTPQSFTESINRAIAMHPDRLVTFSYAHVPWVNSAQSQLEKAGLPTPAEKNLLYETAKHTLTQASYKTIGLDHFVLPEDELYIANLSKTLHRNFQGYCTRRTTGQVYAFGITGISQLTSAYSQNTKNLNEYIEAINHQQRPVFKGYILNNEEQITREVIDTLMCNYEIYWDGMATYLHRSTDEIKGALHYDEKALSEFAEDGLITFDSEHIAMLPEATPYVRIVAASLDKLMLNTDKHFSKVG
jgi:oxygen-independent coproporphyrinogen-3 oxidase